MENKVALVTGGNRGLGLATCRELARRGMTVLLTSRDDSGEALAREIGCAFEKLDVSSSRSIDELFRRVEKKYGRLDVLVNNAGILDREAVADRATLVKVFETNTLGPYEMARAFFPLMKKKGYGRIVNVSSQMGQLSSMGGDSPAYRLSKTALNAVTVMFAGQVGDANIRVNSVCPGWVKTDMGGSGARRTLEEGIETIVWAATLPEDGPNGTFLHDKHVIAW